MNSTSTTLPAAPCQSGNGFCRNMLYSLVQQMVRQVSTRSSPTADHLSIWSHQGLGGELGFLHLDINVCEYIEYGTSHDQLTSSVARKEDGCMVLVIAAVPCSLYERLTTRGNNSVEATTPAKNLDLPEDAASFCHKVPFPFPAGC